jgi:hypothetical protein
MDRAAAEAMARDQAQEYAAHTSRVAKTKTTAKPATMEQESDGGGGELSYMVEHNPSDEARNVLVESKAEIENRQRLAQVSAAAAKEREGYGKYDKMRRMLPEGAVRQKMEMDGISSSDIEAYFQ